MRLFVLVLSSARNKINSSLNAKHTQGASKLFSERVSSAVDFEVKMATG